MPGTSPLLGRAALMIARDYTLEEAAKKRLKDAKAELKKAKLKPRKLVKEPKDMGGFGMERCVICNVHTGMWLQPENAPLCSPACMHKYLADPTVYDPLGLYGKPVGKMLIVRGDQRGPPATKIKCPACDKTFGFGNEDEGPLPGMWEEVTCPYCGKELISTMTWKVRTK